MSATRPTDPHASAARVRAVGRSLLVYRGSQALLACALCVGCEEEPLSVEGAHVTLRYSQGQEICAGTVEYLDLAYEEVADRMTLPPASQRRIEYTLNPEGGVCEDARGCAAENGREVWGRGVDLTHELVHALQYQLTGEAALPFLSEGLAVALGGPEGLVQLARSYGSIEADVVAPPATIKADLAGDFVSFLIDEHGFGPFQELLLTAPRATTSLALAQALEETYQRTLSELVEDRWSTARFYPQARLGLPQCSIEPRAWDGDTWSASVDLACQSARAIGPTVQDRETRSVVYESVEIDTAATYLVELEGSGDSSLVEIANPCGPTRVPVPRAHLIGVAGRQLAVVPLEAGSHYFAFSSLLADDAAVSIRMRAYDTTNETACPQETLDLAADAKGISLLARAGEQVAVRFTPRSRRAATLQWQGLINPEICTGPCDALACRRIQTLAFDEETFEVVLDLPAEPHLLRYEAVSGAGQGFLRATLE